MYSNTAAVFRPDLAGYVEQASTWEKGLIASKVYPVVNVDRDSGFYPIFKLATGNLLRNDVKIRAPNAAFARGTRAFEQDTYTCVEYGFEESLDDIIQKRMMPFFDAEVVAAKLALRKVLLAYEVRVAASIFSTVNYGTAISAPLDYNKTNLATFDFGNDVDVAKTQLNASGEDTSDVICVISGQLWNRIRASTKFQNRARGMGVSNDAILNLTVQTAAQILDIKALYVGRNYYDTSAEGKAFSGSQIWGNTYFWLGRATDAGSPAAMLQGGAGYTLNWSEYGPVNSVFTWRDERIKSDVVRSSQYVTEKVVNANAGCLTTTGYSLTA